MPSNTYGSCYCSLMRSLRNPSRSPTVFYLSNIYLTVTRVDPYRTSFANVWAQTAPI